MKDYYHNHLKGRKNDLHKCGGISNGHLNKQQQALRKFAEYLRQTGKLTIGKFDIRNEEITGKKIDVLTIEEIKQLYAATYIYNDVTLNLSNPSMGMPPKMVKPNSSVV